MGKDSKSVLSGGEMMCRLGLDPASGDEIPFNIGDKDFTAAYLDHAHHPLVDF